MAGLNTRSTTANTQVPQGILQPAFSNMHIQQGNMLSAARNRQARQGNMQPSPSRPQIPQDATLLNPERLVRQSRGNSDPRGSSDLGRLSLLGRFDPAAAAFEPQDLRELRLERDRSQAFYNSMNDEVGLFLKLSEELETTMVDLRRLSTEVKDVAERIQNRPVDLQLQVSKLRELATEIEAMAATHETWNAVIAKNIQDAAECWARWERPPGRRPWL
ncbi:hypothetical protein MMC30_001910 [Trapelia coarctata]|nr:hypothetical protein [Trapelia coarctata]